MNLYGTPTSPYVRKARILVRAAGLDVTFVDTRTAPGASALARLSPVGKVPVLERGEGETPHVLADSGVIASWLWAHHAPALRAAGFVVVPDDWAERERLVLVEGALDAAINRLYLLRDGLPDKGYVTRQGERVVTILAALEASLPAFSRPLATSALTLGCALDWMVFRKLTDPRRTPRLGAFYDDWLASGVGAGTEPVS
ncbi:MAG: gst [Myxococcales bacterium]|nr:gst [Myxococcales bacterium]